MNIFSSTVHDILTLKLGRLLEEGLVIADANKNENRSMSKVILEKVMIDFFNCI